VSEAARESDASREAPRLTKEQKLERLLAAAAGLMAQQGYSQTSIRDVARESGFSLAGMYYYFESKEDLLYQIQHGTFSRLLAEQELQASAIADPQLRLRSLIGTHLAFFQAHAGEMKVCTYELESLNGEPYEAIESLRRRYYRLTAELVAEILDVSEADRKSVARVRHLTLFIFGALNWVFMWYQPKKDVAVGQLAEEMADFVAGGLHAQLRKGE
jgi:AcrR family transcriptional regulator